jgi:hypothetical protein
MEKPMVNSRLASPAIPFALALSLLGPGGCSAPAGGRWFDREPPRVVIRDAPLLRFPANTDCNSPSHWSGGTFHLFVSAGAPKRATGPDLFHLGPAIPSTYDDVVQGGRWIECTWKDRDGTLFGWYHHEPTGVCPGTGLTAPRIGAVWSGDDGATFHDLGIVLDAPPGTIRCDARNGFFAGGHGDFSAMLDPREEYLYLFFSTYAGPVEDQGVAVARMRWVDRWSPVGKVWKGCRGSWGEPGLCGAATPIFPAKVDWARFDADAFWGPSIHWNSHLGLYAILLNRTANRKPGGEAWPQEGIYAAFNDDLAEPARWTTPAKVLDGGRWYPQVTGTDAAARETDKVAGRCARFSMRGADEVGESRWEALFLRAGEEP